MKNYSISAIFGSSIRIADCNVIVPPSLSSPLTKTRTIMTTLLCTFVYLFSAYTTPISSDAQVIHQSFEVGDHKTITLSLDMPYEVEIWAGNTILTETKVRMDNIPPSILKHFIQKGRYEILENNLETTLELSLKDLNRFPIKTKNGQAEETVNIRIFVPEACTVHQMGKGQAIAMEDTGE